MFISKGIESEVQELLVEYARILHNTLIDRRTYILPLEQDRINAIRKQLARMGLVLSVTTPDPTFPEEFKVGVKGPHSDMTPEDKKHYNEWFAIANDLPIL